MNTPQSDKSIEEPSVRLKIAGILKLYKEDTVDYIRTAIAIESLISTQLQKQLDMLIMGIGEDDPAASAIYRANNYSGTEEEWQIEVVKNERAKARNEMRTQIRTAIQAMRSDYSPNTPR